MRNLTAALIAASASAAVMYAIKRYFFSTHSLNAAKKKVAIPTTLHICTTCSVSKRLTEDQKTGVKEPTGENLFRRVVSYLASLKEWTLQSDGCEKIVGEEGIATDRQYTFCTPQGESIVINPQKCLSACKMASCVAYSHPNKFQYHFAMMDPNQSGDIEDIVKFARFYAECDGDAFTKKSDRPDRLASTIVSRLPPPIPSPPCSST